MKNLLNRNVPVLFHFVRYALHLTVLTRKATPCNAICHVALLTFVRSIRLVRSVIYVRERKTYKITGPPKIKFYL